MSANKFLVAVRGDDQVLVLNPPVGPITKADALNLAAWLVALADDDPERATFNELLNEVLSS